MNDTEWLELNFANPTDEDLDFFIERVGFRFESDNVVSLKEARLAALAELKRKYAS
jgi:hypothetical protein